MKSLLFVILYITSLSSYAVESSFPEDVLEFIDKRDGCDHFRGEPIYSKERQEFLLKSMIELCTGTDGELAVLKSKYQNNKIIISTLSIYDNNIE